MNFEEFEQLPPVKQFLALTRKIETADTPLLFHGDPAQGQARQWRIGSISMQEGLTLRCQGEKQKMLMADFVAANRQVLAALFAPEALDDNGEFELGRLPEPET